MPETTRRRAVTGARAPGQPAARAAASAPLLAAASRRPPRRLPTHTPGGAGDGLPPGLRAVALAMSERQLEGLLRGGIADVRKLAPWFLAHHIWQDHATRAAKGWFDWALCGPGGAAFWELKREAKDPTDEQQAWLDGFTAAGLVAVVRRPSDWLCGRMTRELAALAGLGGGR